MYIIWFMHNANFNIQFQHVCQENKEFLNIENSQEKRYRLELWIIPKTNYNENMEGAGYWLLYNEHNVTPPLH